MLLGHYRTVKRDPKPALRSAADLLSFWDKWTEGLFTPTADEKWGSFIRVASKLYPHGPGQRELWERAGGKTAELPKGGTGGSLWRSALFLARKGGRPSSAALLREMRHDFAANRELRLLG
ncbi:effector-associated domain EAD1-containing protein [Brevundimonas sp. TWP2-3-4b1]|uniref:effector-associated domain EAD1-containing protein n=1 Tax=Brevundimonas sp. TWP2-3-4b1 TaxID=2804580 RepID=UPI003CF19BBC